MITKHKKANFILQWLYLKFNIIFRTRKNLKTWKTIEIGTHKTIEELKEDTKVRGGRIDGLAVHMLPHLQLARKRSLLDLVKVTPKELGFANGAEYDDIIKAATIGRLDLCPDEVGIQLLRQYPEIPLGECIYVGMRGIKLFGGDPIIFAVEHYPSDASKHGGRYLRRGGYTLPNSGNSHYKGDSAFIFIHRNK